MRVALLPAGSVDSQVLPFEAARQREEAPPPVKEASKRGGVPGYDIISAAKGNLQGRIEGRVALT